jgi:KaiC/GvpD/RAD55 family RecA-like ATPase
MPATPRKVDLTQEELSAASNAAFRRNTGDATPVFGEDPNLPRVWDIRDLANRPQAVWLIDNLIEEKGLTVFFGPDKVGKTAVLSNFLWAWAGGHSSFLNDDFAMAGEDRKVLYVLLEGQSNFYSRYDAWCHAYHDGGDIDGFFVMDEGLSLFQKSMEWEDPSTWTPSALKLWNAVEALRPQILVIDTLSRATAGMDENSSSMAHVVGMLDHMRDVFDLSTIIVHHTSLSDGDRPRGHSSLKGAASSYARIEGKPENTVLTLRTGPHRNSDVFKNIPFTREHERSSFVIRGSKAAEKRTLKQQLLDMVELPGKATLNDLATMLYMEDSPINRKKVMSIVQNTERVEYKEGWVRYIKEEEVEEIT